MEVILPVIITSGVCTAIMVSVMFLIDSDLLPDEVDTFFENRSHKKSVNISMIQL